MKKLIRKSTFETNSSSAHSISLAGEDKEFILDTIYPDQDGNIILDGGKFGWQWFKYNDALMKANYIAVSGQFDDILKTVIKDVTGCNEVIFNFSVDWDAEYNFSYIDHESLYNISLVTYDDIKNFIFNKNSWLFGGNDNKNARPNFYDVSTYTSDGEVTPKYTHKLTIEPVGLTAMFREYPDQDVIEECIETLLEGIELVDLDYVSRENWAKTKFIEYPGYDFKCVIKSYYAGWEKIYRYGNYGQIINNRIIVPAIFDFERLDHETYDAYEDRLRKEILDTKMYKELVYKIDVC